MTISLATNPATTKLVIEILSHILDLNKSLLVK